MFPLMLFDGMLLDANLETKIPVPFVFNTWFTLIYLLQRKVE